MKAALLAITFLFLLAVGRTSAQQQGVETSSQSTGPTGSLPADRIASLMTHDATAANSELKVGKKLRLRGPLIHPFKGRKLAEVPRRVLHLVNPFAPSRPEPTDNTNKLNARTWTETVGLRPGMSAFPDAATHESSLSLVSLSR